MERKCFTTCLETTADFVARPLIVILDEFSEDFLTSTLVVTPEDTETPAPLEPTRKGSDDLSNIWKNPVMCAGEKASAFFTL
jgi:hypothetical protein